MEINNMQDQGYDPISARQAVVASSLSGLNWYGNVVNVHIDEESGTVVTDEDALTRDEFFQALGKVSRPDSQASDVK